MDVGLPRGQMGNSEVGHLNLGAGRIVYQDLTRINKAVEDGELEKNPVLQEAFAQAKGHRLHLLGLLSDGGVHSHIDHLVALANAAKQAGVRDIMVHAITDGRDTSPTGGAAISGDGVEKELATERGGDRDGGGTLLCDGSRQALGAEQTGVGRDCAGARRGSGRTRPRRR